MRIHSQAENAFKKYMELNGEKEKQVHVLHARATHLLNYFNARALLKSGAITEMKELEFECGSISSFEHGKKTFEIETREGCFALKLKKSGRYVIFTSWLSGYKMDMENIVTGTQGEVVELFQAVRNLTVKQSKPKLGIYRVEASNVRLIYKKMKKKELPKIDIVHHLADDVDQHIAYYFSNVSRYLIGNRSGRKTVLLHGPQGTGKSSMAFQIAASYEKTHCVVFATDIGSVYGHSELAAKHKVPTIIIFEDCEMALAEGRVNGRIKNFLSGIDSKQNPAGCYTIMTTNHPKQLDKTVVFRKGRIDKLFYISKLSGEYLKKCVNLYFNFFDEGQKSQVFSEMSDHAYSGSEVEAIAEETITIAAKEGVEAPTVQHAIDALSAIREDINKIEYDESDFDFEYQKKKFGF